jgi:hypothetical protein
MSDDDKPQIPVQLRRAADVTLHPDPRQWPMGMFIYGPEDLPAAEREAYAVLDLIVAEFESDPMSVQCFDLKLVDRAKKAVEPYRQLIRQSAKIEQNSTKSLKSSDNRV